ncbi:MAG TPA: hypothetical protein VG387_15545 [Rhizomicrobium sp.]|jgi:hypothetical protein|nr:hypothetical protein [Rhizomicrobium sp.]
MSKKVNFSIANNWDEFPMYKIPRLKWRKKIIGGGYVTRVKGKRWTVRLNDFPDEPLYTLIVGGDEILHFDDWPTEWIK